MLSAELPATQRDPLAEKQSRPPELVVITPIEAWTCTACGGTGDLLIVKPPGPLFLTCADLDHLLSSGPATPR